MFVSLFRTFVKKGMELCSVVRNGDQGYDTLVRCVRGIALHCIAFHCNGTG